MNIVAELSFFSVLDGGVINIYVTWIELQMLKEKSLFSCYIILTPVAHSKFIFVLGTNKSLYFGRSESIFPLHLGSNLTILPLGGSQFSVCRMKASLWKGKEDKNHLCWVTISTAIWRTNKETIGFYESNREIICTTVKPSGCPGLRGMA